MTKGEKIRVKHYDGKIVRYAFNSRYPSRYQIYSVIIWILTDEDINVYCIKKEVSEEFKQWVKDNYKENCEKVRKRWGELEKKWNEEYRKKS